MKKSECQAHQKQQCASCNNNFRMFDGKCYQEPYRHYMALKDECFLYENDNTAAGSHSSNLWSILQVYSSISYEICLFRSYKQVVSIGSHKTVNLIGKSDPYWIRENGFRSVGGTKCANGIDRTSEVEFVCGNKTKIISILEYKTCYYKVKFETPLQCK